LEVVEQLLLNRCSKKFTPSSFLTLLRRDFGRIWPVTASKTLEVKNNHVHVRTPGILNKFPENKIFVQFGRDAGSIYNQSILLDSYSSIGKD
jgi:hypothetical protein